MTRIRPRTREWLVTGSMLALVLGSVGGLWLYTRNADRRQQLQFERATELATRSMVGRAGGLSTVVWKGDTVPFPPRDGRRTLLYVRRGGCEPCERVDRSLAAALRKRREPLPVWIVHEGPSAFDGAAFRAVPGVELTTSVGVGEFSRHYGISAVPFLALLSEGGTIEKVNVGYSRPGDIQAFVADGFSDQPSPGASASDR